MSGKILIFTDLDGTLLNRDTFEFGTIKEYVKYLLSKNISIIPNSSKTEAEILEFNSELGEDLPFISENGAAVHNMDLINQSLPKKIILSREKNELLKIFKSKINDKLISKCKFVLSLKESEKSKIFGLTGEKLNSALKREFSIPILFEGTKNEKIDLSQLIKNNGLTLQDGGRITNLCDKTSKALAMKNVIRIFKKTEKQNLSIIGVGDNLNDLDMLKNCDIACLVFNDKFKLERINIDNCLVSKKPAPEGWQEVVNLALDKIK